jgi:predicted enzyme related to lactoylglutathione lyase
MGKVAVLLADLNFALMWVSDDGGFGNRAFIGRRDGRLFLDGDAVDRDAEGPLPDDVADEALYAEVPNARTLDLGNALAFAFTDEVAPRLRDAVRAAFRRRGAWRAFRDLLTRERLDDAWHAFKDRETRRALVRWARDEGFEVPGEPPDAEGSAGAGVEGDDEDVDATARAPNAPQRSQGGSVAQDARAGLFVYAKDLGRLATFYGEVIGLARVHATEDLVVLRGQGLDLLVHAIPAHIAADITIESPPLRREDTALKFFFTVPSLALAAGVAARHGGAVDDDAWQGPGFRVRNAIDPEGNVFQLREALD